MQNSLHDSRLGVNLVLKALKTSLLYLILMKLRKVIKLNWGTCRVLMRLLSSLWKKLLLFFCCFWQVLGRHWWFFWFRNPSDFYLFSLQYGTFFRFWEENWQHFHVFFSLRCIIFSVEECIYVLNDAARCWVLAFNIKTTFWVDCIIAMCLFIYTQRKK